MTVGELYAFAIERGLAIDPRGEVWLRDRMAGLAANFEGLSGLPRRLFDRERLRNPFGDTRLLGGDPAAPVQRLVCGVNITGAEILLADRLRDHGRPVDLVLAHHASAPGGGVASREDVLWAQIAMLTDFGVAPHRADQLIRGQVAQMAAGGLPDRSTDFHLNQIAAALGLPYMTIHGPADLYLLQEGRRVLAEEQPRTVGELRDITDAWPEVQWMMDRGLATRIAVGHPDTPTGRVYTAFYGGWNPTPQVFEAMCDAGCGTLWVVDTSPELDEVARRRGVSIVVIPHMPADNYGLNRLFDDAMDRFGDFEVVEAGGFVRVDRRSGQAGAP